MNRLSSRQLGLPAILLATLALGCGGSAPGGSADGGPPASSTEASEQAKQAEALRSRSDLPPEERALAVVDGKERWVDAEAAQAAGYTLVDLSDDWTPSIFAEELAEDGT